MTIWPGCSVVSAELAPDHAFDVLSLVGLVALAVPMIKLLSVTLLVVLSNVIATLPANAPESLYCICVFEPAALAVATIPVNCDPLPMK